MKRFTPNVHALPLRFDAIPDGAYQIRMRESFIQKANFLLSRKYRPRDNRMFQIGMEIEYSVVSQANGGIQLVDEGVRDAAIEEFWNRRDNIPGFVSWELGASQIEINTLPIDLKKNPGNALLREMIKCERSLNEYLKKEHNAHLLRIGCFPLLPISHIKRTSTKDKYTLCPNFHNTNQRPGLNNFIGTEDPIDVRDAAIPALTNAVQANIDCYSVEEAVKVLNYSFMHSPYITAIGANAGMIDCKDSHLADIRYIAWKISHDIRDWYESQNGTNTRVGMPSRYYETIEEYLESVLRHPFFMENVEAAFDMAIGTYWRDARIKFLDKPDGIQLVVELRPLSTQPTVQDDYSLLMQYIGRVFYDHHYSRPLLPIQYVRANKEMAMRMGRQGFYWAYDQHDQIRQFTFNELFDREIDTGMQGLSELGVDTESVSFIRTHIKENYRECAPVDRFRALVQNKVDGGNDMPTAMASAIKELNLIVP